MAYMGRGGFSSFRSRSGGSFGHRHSNIHSGRRYYRGCFFRTHYYLPFNNTYFVCQLIASLIIYTIVGITFLITYKPSIIDPLEDTKRIIMNTYIIINLSILVILPLANYFSKDKKALIKRLIALLLIAIITVLVFFGIKTHMDYTYTENKFEEIYIQENGKNNSNTKSKLDIGITGIKIKTGKKYYIDECVKAYNIFILRMYGILTVNILLIILLIYQISKVSKIQEKRDRLSKDDAILFDEEENVKF